ARATARIVRQRFPKARIVAGGHHATLYPRETAALPEIDFVVCGEGERVFARLVQELRETGSQPRPDVLDAIGGLAWKTRTGQVRFNPMKDEGVDYDGLPAPAHHLIDFKVSSRTDMVTPEVLAALRAAGCYRIHYGVESATPRLLDYLEKGSTPERVKRAFKLTREAGIQTYAYMMIGIPTETREEMFASVDYVTKTLRADYAQFSILTPYPKTAL